MLSYRHAFHAGNHADVLKHFVLMQLIRYLQQKDTPFHFIDTHAGAGLYSLEGGYAAKNAEYETGISRLWQRKDLPTPLAEYVQLVKQLNPDGKLRHYPGSPWIANALLREQDRLRLIELHPSDGKILQDNFRRLEAHEGKPRGRGTRVMIEQADGFAALKAQLPPPSRRALVLIDPPYEVKTDYRSVSDALADALKRFATGTYAIWYPVLQRQESKQFADRIKRLPANGWLNVTLSVSGPSPDGFGLRSSGMLVLNPPWTLEATLKDVMPFLVSALGQDSGAGFTLESGETLAAVGAKRRQAE
ncbi:MAG: 23S rRNA (adenine(2030)-N(6))-methyltransferase RlmJ [Burkholderiaceae bacterium]|nr:23S rRNA (adenine(2030)-N(6))-methyltransferase RlmJ [Burkholderiaceae bacterium]